MITLKVNQKVVCINSKPFDQNCDNDVAKHIVEGNIYEIRLVGPYYWKDINETIISVKLKGITRKMPFAAFRFRPLITVEDFMKNGIDEHVRKEMELDHPIESGWTPLGFIPRP